MGLNFEIIVNLDAPVTLSDGSLHQFSIDEVISILDNHNCKYAAAPHVPDAKSSFNHWHVGIHTDSHNSYDTIAKWFNLPTNAVQGIRGQFKTTYCLYLIHYNQPGKTPVDPSLVLSNWDLDYDKLIKKVVSSNYIDEVINRILDGSLSETAFYSGDYGALYVKYKRHIDTAFEYYYDTLRKKVLKMKDDSAIDVIFIYGDSRTGKSAFVSDQCKRLGLSLCISSSSNDILQDYKDEDVLLLDDLRDDALKLHDFLKFTDPHIRSTTQSRYHNKCFVGRTIFIATTKPLEAWYSNCKNEQRVQFTSRLKEVYRFRIDSIERFVHKDGIDKAEFVSAGVFPNFISEKYAVSSKSVSDFTQQILSAITSQEAFIPPVSEQLSIPAGFHRVYGDDPFYDL